MPYHTSYLRISLLIIISLLLLFFAQGQQINTAVNNAYVLTRMAEKFHVQPRPLDDEFSSDVFTQLLKQLDEDKIFFTAADIKTFSKFRLELDDEIKNKQSTFLLAVLKIFGNRVAGTDTMIDNICKKPFDFSLPEKITKAEDTSYSTDEKARRMKLYKLLKSTALDILTKNDDLIILNETEQKRYVDSLEPTARLKARQTLKHYINIISQNAGGIEQYLGNEYCKAIAVCYDPHSEYFILTEKEDFDGELGQEQMVFGFHCMEEADGAVGIENIKPGSPAFKSGQINNGDKILSVQWEDRQPIDVSSGGLKQLYEVLGMSNHDKATFKIKKQDGTERLVVLLKQKMENNGEQNKVKSFLLRGSKTIGFISLPSFYQDWTNDSTGANGCANDVAKEIMKLKKENIEGLVIDLRYNGGGSLEEAIELSGIFIDVGPVGMEKGRDAKIYTLRDVNRGTIYDGPLMLLVNSYTASAAEVVAGTLQDYHRAVIVGTPTYGKATAQAVLPMDTTIDLSKDFSDVKSDGYFKVTVSKLYRVNGTTAQAKGVQPDIVLPDMLETHPQREAENDHVLITQVIEGAKYFKPYPIINLDVLKTFAIQQIDSSAQFQLIKKDIEIARAEGDNKEVNLQLADVVKERKKFVEREMNTAFVEPVRAPYTVVNNSFEKEQLKMNDDLEEMNRQWVKVLRNDPYVQATYEMMLLMIK
ncbi:MAG: carboxy terminal-processing peptidase [Ginsengibacter sp.]